MFGRRQNQCGWYYRLVRGVVNLKELSVTFVLSQIAVLTELYVLYIF